VRGFPHIKGPDLLGASGIVPLSPLGFDRPGGTLVMEWAMRGGWDLVSVVQLQRSATRPQPAKDMAHFPSWGSPLLWQPKGPLMIKGPHGVRQPRLAVHGVNAVAVHAPSRVVRLTGGHIPLTRPIAHVSDLVASARMAHPPRGGL
jgi:hypothetical protein